MSNRRSCGLRAFLNLPRCLGNVCLVRDVVPVEYGVCLVAGNFPRRLLWHATANHIPHSRTPQIVEEKPWHSRCLYKRLPCFPKVFHWLAVRPRNQVILGLLPLAQLCNDLAALFGETHSAALVILRLARVEAQRIVEQV